MFFPFKKPKVYRVTPDTLTTKYNLHNFYNHYKSSTQANMKYKAIAASNLYLGRDQAAIPP
jgi:hypothetical protein